MSQKANRANIVSNDGAIALRQCVLVFMIMGLYVGIMVDWPILVSLSTLSAALLYGDFRAWVARNSAEQVKG